MKSAVFDIETTALEGIGAGFLLCVCVRPLDTKRTRSFRLHYAPDPMLGFLENEEKELLAQVIDELSKYDLLIGHNIDKFDLPYLQSRSVVRGMPFPIKPFIYDTMKAWGRVKLRTVMNGYGKPTKSLAMIADFLGIDQLKTGTYPRERWQTIWGSEQEREEAMREIVDHCERDVRMNYQIYKIILPLDDRGSIKRWT